MLGISKERILVSKRTHIILISIFISLSTFSTIYSQKKDFFPLSVGNEVHYSYFVEYASYKSPLYPAESHDDFSKDSGEVAYKFIDSTLLNDTTVVWTIREIRDLFSFQWHLDSLGVRDTVTYKKIDSAEYPLYEYTSGLHGLYAYMLVFNFSGKVYRYSDTVADSIVYNLQSVPYTFVKNIGLTKILYSNSFVGNFSYENYTKKITLIRDITNIDSRNIKQYRYYLRQNYPNPFNPTTTIEYSIPKTSFVSIEVYDFLGKKVAALVNEVKKEGDYKVKFNASFLSSGIYFYRMQAGNFVETKKLILLK